MACKTPDLIPLDAFTNTNWNIDAAPVAVFNHATTLHDRLAYCWGLASRLSDVIQFLSVHPDSELQRIAMLLECHASPLVAVLDLMASETVPGRV
jgi:hypothetical protein